MGIVEGPGRRIGLDWIGRGPEYESAALRPLAIPVVAGERLASDILVVG